MLTIEEIEHAISAHSAWLKKIKTVVAVSTINDAPSDMTKNKKTVIKIESDELCTFGKWLYTTIEEKHKKSIYYQEAVNFHAKFHQDAANILSLAFQGEKYQVSTLITDDSDFIQNSSKLIATLEKWKDSL
jgi:hypothetical protein